MPRVKTPLTIIRRSRRVEFRYKDEFYVYEYRTQGGEGYSFIWKSDQRIYGPLVGHATEEGNEIFKVISKEIEAGRF